MSLKQSLIKFFKPEWKKILLLFFLEFLVSFAMLFVGDRIPSWESYLISPNVFYLESAINPMFITPESLSFHVAFSNLISLAYLYFLSCFIIEGRRTLKNFLLKLMFKE
jgi:hypothetical protein